MNIELNDEEISLLNDALSGLRGMSEGPRSAEVDRFVNDHPEFTLDFG